MTQNLYQLVKYNDLIDFLKGGKDKFIVLTLVDDYTDNSVKAMLKRYIKDKSKIFSNVTFLYYTVKSEDLGKISILDEDLANYPKMLHIYNVYTMLIGVNSISLIEDVTNAFSKVEKYYMDDLNGENQGSGEVNNLESDSEKRVMPDKGKKPTASVPVVKPTVPKPVQPTITEEPSYVVDPMVEKKKFLDKIILLKNKTEQFNKDFLKDVMNRKKEEEKKDKSKN